MPDVKLTLTAEEKDALAKIRATEQGLSQIELTANRAGKAFDNLFGKMSKALSVHGNLRPSQIAQQLMGKLTPTGASLAAAAGTDRGSVAAATGGLRAYADKLRQSILSDVKKSAAVTASEQRYYGGMEPSAAKSAKRQITSFIKANELGDVDGDINRFVGRVVRQQLKASQRAIIESAKEAGGSHEILQLAQAAGVNVGRPSEVRQFVAERAHQAEVREASIASDAESAARRTQADQSRHAQQAAERARIAGVFTNTRGAAQAIAKTPSVLAGARFEGYNVEDPEAVQQYRDRRARELRDERASRPNRRVQAGEDAAEEARLANRRRVANAFESSSDAARVIAKTPRVLDEARFEGYDVNDPEAISTYRYRRAKELRARRWATPDRDERAAQNEFDEARLANRQRIASVFDAHDEEVSAQRDGTNLRASRVREVRDLRAQKLAAQWSAVGSVASEVAGAGVAGIYAGEQIFGNYNEKMREYDDAITGIEPTYREVMGIGGNAGRQKQLRSLIGDTAITFGQSTREVSNAFYDVYSAAGNLSDDKQREIIKSSLKFQSVAGGELPVIGKAMTTIQQLFGPKLGSVDRAASIIKKTIDYGKFDPTAFASLSPEAYSAAALHGIGMEESSAVMASISNREGTDRRMFTGARTLFEKMDVAADKGLVTRGDPFLSQIRQLKKATPQQLEKVFGETGVNAASNARDMIDDIDALSKTMSSQTGDELAQQQVQLINDPINMMSKIGQSIDIFGQNSLQMLGQQGGPDGMKRIAKSLVTRMALEGQKQMAPEYLAAGGATMLANLNANKAMYAKYAAGPIEAALEAQGGPAGVRMVQAIRIMNGEVQVGEERHPGAQEEPFSGRVQMDPIMSSEDDVADFFKMVADEHADGLTAPEYSQVRLLRARGDDAGATSVLDGARKRGAVTVPASAGTRRGFTSVVQAIPRSASALIHGLVPESVIAMVKKVDSFIPSGSQIQDRYNKKFISDAIKSAQDDLSTSTAGGDLYGADDARKRLFDIRDKRRKLAFDKDGYTATDRQTLVDDITGGGGSSPLDAATNRLAQVVEQLAAVLGNRVGGGAPPTTQPSNNGPTTRKSPIPPTTRPANP